MAKSFEVHVKLVDETGKVVGTAVMEKVYASKGNATKLAMKVADAKVAEATVVEAE